MKEILLSLKPRWLELMEDGAKTAELRTIFPEDYIGWVNVYCTKDPKYPIFRNGIEINGKVVARFYCEKVEKALKVIRGVGFSFYKTKTLTEEDLKKRSCVSYDGINNYFFGKKGKVIHVSNFTMLDNPKELNDFVIPCHIEAVVESTGEHIIITNKVCLRAPQNYCYVEGKED